MLIGYIGAGLIGLAIAAILAGLGERQSAGVERLANAGLATPGSVPPVPAAIPATQAGPSFAARIAARAQRLTPGRGKDLDREKASRVRSRLDRAGLLMPPEGLAALKLAGLGLGVLIGLVVSVLVATLTALGATAGVVIAVALAALGFFAPDLWVLHTAQARQQAIQQAMPETLDLLALTAQAGLGLEQGIGEVGGELQGPLAVELDRFLREQQLGRSRRDALRNLAERNPAEDLQSLTQALLQADELGTPIATTLQVQAREMRRRRRARARERAGKAPVKLLFPLIFGIFPALFVIIMGPGVLSIIEALG